MHCVVCASMDKVHDYKPVDLQYRYVYIFLVPKDPVVLLLKSLKHSIWNALVPHPVATRKSVNVT